MDNDKNDKKSQKVLKEAKNGKKEGKLEIIFLRILC